VDAATVAIPGKKEQAPLSPGESAPADRALVSVELLESDLAECGCLYSGACILSIDDLVRAGDLVTVTNAGPYSLLTGARAFLFTVNAMLTTEVG
jgi:hypothetical protein